MDFLPNSSRRRWSALGAGLLLAVLALGVTALITPDVLAQAGDASGGAATTTTSVGQALENVEGRWEGGLKVAIVIALFVVPIFLGGAIAKALRMPDHGWKIAIALGVIAAAAVVVSTGRIRLGPDLSGGIILIYELAEESTDQTAAIADGEKGAAPDSGPTGGGATRDEVVSRLITVLTKRVDPTGVKEVSIRKYGEGQIEIIIPAAEQQELEHIQRKISTAGSLVFRITASNKFPEHRQVIKIATEQLAPGQDIVKLEDKEYARWVLLDETEFPTIDEAIARGLVTRQSANGPQALVMTNDGLDVTGEMIRMAAADVDETGKPQVSFSFGPLGAARFGQLTGQHEPTPSGERYNLGIVMDNRLISAPTIESRITDRGRISGNMPQQDVDFIVEILQAGSLPAALNKTPISKAQISPTLGAQTVEKGKVALTISLALVALFMMFYYRLAGVISVIGLAINMLLIVGAMVLIKGAFTLPGLAGLVLTVGMSVDANVLIYERIREELKRGAALRMAIRNGFDRATTTIIDSNVTNLITGIVIYKIAPDNVKGFGITLVLGIAMSIFVAVFLTRIVFDVAEKRHWITTLRMRQFIGETNYDFLGWRRVCIGASAVVIAVGLLAVAARRGDLLDIDFTGGSSVQFVLDDEHKMTFPEVMDVLQSGALADDNLSLVRVGNTNTQYTVTTVNDDVAGVEKILTEAFAGKLKTYEVEVIDAKAIPATGAVGALERPIPGLRWWATASLPMSQISLLQVAPATDETETPADAAPAGDAADEVATDVTPPATEEGDPAVDDAEEDQPATDAAAPADGAADAATEAAPAAVDPFAGGTTATIRFGEVAQTQAEGESTPVGGVSYSAMEQLLLDALKASGFEGAAYQIANPGYTTATARNFPEWTVKIALPQADAQKVFESIEGSLDGKPVFPLSNKIGGRVAKQMATDAVAAIILCLAGIIGYVWFRFHGVIYGVAAVVALIHDVLVALGAVALSAFLVEYAPPVARALMIDKFQVSLTLVAAFLTIIGYSLNDTIVIFDRIREVKGKSPRLTATMINAAVNQCFARTLLTSFTSLISVFVLYIVGGEGIHAFAFALLVGFFAGVYSTIYIANPVLLWLSQRAEAAAAGAATKAA